jgi:hypothetical protein
MKAMMPKSRSRLKAAPTSGCAFKKNLKSPASEVLYYKKELAPHETNNPF